MRGCKYTHEPCANYTEFCTLPVPQEVVKEQKANDKLLIAQGITPPSRNPKPQQQQRPPSPSGQGNWKGQGDWKGGKKGDSKGKKGKGKPKGKGRGKGYGYTWYDDGSSQWTGDD